MNPASHKSTGGGRKGFYCPMKASSKYYFIITYGCQMNEADSVWLGKIFEKCGYSRAKELADADIVLINTCSVRQAAEDKVYGLAPKLQKFKIQNLEFKVILTGCMVGSATGERQRIKLDTLERRMPWVDYFVPPGDVFETLPRIISKVTTGERGSELGGKCSSFASPKGVVIEESSRGKEAYVPIMRGCDNFCSYCVVPYGRGAEQYRAFNKVVQDVEELVEQGVRSVTLLGQNVNSYPEFARLLRVLHGIEGLEELWFLTSNPWDFPPELVGALALPKIRRYLHLPLQSGDNEILKKMNRPYTVEEYKDLVKRIRGRVPDIELGTDLIVGFPGETREQFQNTVDVVEDIGFHGAYIAMYSPRPGTAAARHFKDDVPREEKKRRHAELTAVVEKSG